MHDIDEIVDTIFSVTILPQSKKYIIKDLVKKSYTLGKNDAFLEIVSYIKNKI